MIYWKSESNDQGKLSQNAKGARYKSESVRTNLNPIEEVLKSVINDSDQMYRNRSSRNLFSVMRHLLKKRGTLYEPGKYNFLLLILFYLLSFSHNSMMHKNVQGESNSLLPTKRRPLLTKTFSDICSNSKYRNVCQVTKSLLLATYILWGKSKYQNACKFSNIAHEHRNKSSRKLFIFNQIEPRKYNFLLLIIFYLLSLSHNLMMHKNEQGESNSHLPTKHRTLLIKTFSDVWGNSKYRNVCQVTKSLFLATSNFGHGGSSNYNLALPDISNFIQIHITIVLYNIQWSSKNYGTSQEKATKSKIQWPPEKVATMQTVANSN